MRLEDTDSVLEQTKTLILTIRFLQNKEIFTEQYRYSEVMYLASTKFNFSFTFGDVLDVQATDQ